MRKEMMCKCLVLIGMIAIFCIVNAKEETKRTWTLQSLTYTDECERICTNTEDGLTCYRQRKEFTNMNSEERKRYINTVKNASTNPLYSETYEHLLTMHKQLFCTKIHKASFFLPWHRWYILNYENLLREINCKVTVPYWDWSLSSEDLLSSDFWDPEDGFGGNGNDSQFCVTTGPFRKGEWSLIDSAGGGCLKRNITSPSPDSVQVATLINSGTDVNFTKFELLLRNDFHDEVHCLINGTMCIDDAASAPEFFLHHGFIDKIWSDYQNRGEAYKFHEFFTSQKEYMPGTKITPDILLDLENQPGGIAVVYVQPTYAIKSILAGPSKAKSRQPLPKISNEAITLFHVSEKELIDLAKDEKTYFSQEKGKQKKHENRRLFPKQKIKGEEETQRNKTLVHA